MDTNLHPKVQGIDFQLPQASLGSGTLSGRHDVHLAKRRSSDNAPSIMVCKAAQHQSAQSSPAPLYAL